MTLPTWSHGRNPWQLMGIMRWSFPSNANSWPSKLAITISAWYKMTPVPRGIFVVNPRVNQLIFNSDPSPITHWGRVTYICASKLTMLGSDNALSPDRHQAIIRTNAGILFIRPKNKLQWNCIRNSNIFIDEIAFENVAVKWRSFCLGLNVLMLALLVLTLEYSRKTRSIP